MNMTSLIKIQTSENNQVINPDFNPINNNNQISDPRLLMKLSIEERNQILTKQAEAILAFYENDQNWQNLQTWDEIDG